MFEPKAIEPINLGKIRISRGGNLYDLWAYKEGMWWRAYYNRPGAKAKVAYQGYFSGLKMKWWTLNGLRDDARHNGLVEVMD